MVQTMLPKSLRAMKFYFTTVYQEIWVGVAITAYVYYKISYGDNRCGCVEGFEGQNLDMGELYGKKAVADKSSGAGHH